MRSTVVVVTATAADVAVVEVKAEVAVVAEV